MKNFYFKTASVFIISFFCSLSFGQVKQITPPNIKSPFQSQSKKVPGNNPIITPSSPTAKTSKPSTEKLKTINGSFFLDLKDLNNPIAQKVQKSKTAKGASSTIDFNSWFNLNSNHTFKFVNEKVGDSIFSHQYYQQYYKGYKVEGSIIMLHFKNNQLTSTSGKVAEFVDFDTNIVISVEEAQKNAMQITNVSILQHTYPVETLVSRVPTENGFDYIFAHKVKIESMNPFVFKDLYIDVKTGKLLNSISLLAHIDTPATANTLYSGTQTITTDYSNGIYTLKDNLRKIETYDATFLNATTDPVLFSNSSTNWEQLPNLKLFSIRGISNNWWYSEFGDTKADLYIIVKDAANNVVYNGKNERENDVTPTSDNPIVFLVNKELKNQPYKVELWDYDVVGEDDFGGSYTLTSTTGSWLVNGNSGFYLIELASNPALDIHWGMEKTYDFYKNILGRNSFDGNGATIRNLYNPPINICDINNACARGTSPINSFMAYGRGDGKKYNPWVGLDIQGHEFTHLVVNNNGFEGLKYQGESGALNESFSDIFGTCVEFFAKPNTANWTIGEDNSIPVGIPLRSMEKPRDYYHPSKYKGTNWKKTNCGTPDLDNDYCGVHFNSGVQNFWFYLLCKGGSDNNDGINYNVTGIGLAKAQKIVYDVLTTQLSSEFSSFYDSYIGSLIVTEQLYGNPSPEYTAVKGAWYAVGIGNDPNSFCSGNTNLIAKTGTFSDGSGTSNYNNNSSCNWVIAPAGATQVSLDFTEFDTEATYDKVYVYDGVDDTATLLGTFSGNTLPSKITTSAGIGAMCIKFTSDATTTLGGWSADYTATIVTPTCSGLTLLTTPTGTFTDGSGSANYTNNQQCFWYIAPPCATSVTLSFSQLNTELNYDGIAVYDSLGATNLIGLYSGTTLPATITSATGTMLVLFISDYANVSQGFTANYTSTGSSYCSGITTLNTSDYGTITDGSGEDNYCNNSNCSWLIQPPQATTVTFNFTEFELEQASTDGNSVYDAVEIFDGTNASAPLLGRFTGSTIPASITSSGGSMYIRFYSDVAYNFQGWSGYYTSTQNGYCNASTNTLTTPTGTFSDGSGANKYSNNADCSWLIQPANASSVTLSFSTFDTELNYDGVIVYDGANNSAPVLGAFTGTTIPSPVKSTGGSMYVSFLSDEAIRSIGWDANYSSSTLGVNEYYFNNKLKIYPNPTSGIFTIQSFFDNAITGKIYDNLGKEVLKSLSITNGMNTIDIANLPKGIYLLKVSDLDETKTIKIIKE
jgi:Zn-dependent metalloprotease